MDSNHKFLVQVLRDIVTSKMHLRVYERAASFWQQLETEMVLEQLVPNANVFVGFLRNFDNYFFLKDESCIWFFRINGNKLYINGTNAPNDTAYVPVTASVTDFSLARPVDFSFGVYVVEKTDNTAVLVVDDEQYAQNVLGENQFYFSLDGFFQGSVLELKVGTNETGQSNLP